tara:strand:+ start:73 stop:342 length:270 start_codon:yes stop_codon:yes gene_type:complete
MFDDGHEFLSFVTKEKRDEYWIGRLVQSKIPIKKDLFDSVPAKMLGMVLKVEEKNDGLAYLLVVRWADGSTYPCYQHSVFTYNKGGRNG